MSVIPESTFGDRVRSPLRDREVAARPRLALHFDTDEHGDDLIVMRFAQRYSVPLRIRLTKVRGF